MDCNIIKDVRELNKNAIIELLQCKDVDQQKLFETARNVRANSKFGNQVELRSVIELSNVCAQRCKYCSIAKDKESIYTLDKETIMNKIISLADAGRRTFLLQSGENHNKHFIDDVAYCCKKTVELYPDVRLILCLGNLSYDDYKLFKDSGATRYILKFETSNSEHHKFCRPSDTIENRLEHINMLIDMGYKVGSGNIVGLPEQTLEHLYQDLVLINDLDLAMVSATRFVSNPLSIFGNYPSGDINLTLNFLAILRILKPNSLMPSTTSLSINKDQGQVNGLLAGCNTVTIHDGTPRKYEQNYGIYSQDRFSPGEEYCRNIVHQCGMEPVKYLI